MLKVHNRKTSSVAYSACWQERRMAARCFYKFAAGWIRVFSCGPRHDSLTGVEMERTQAHNTRSYKLLSPAVACFSLHPLRRDRGSRRPNAPPSCDNYVLVLVNFFTSRITSSFIFERCRGFIMAGAAAHTSPEQSRQRKRPTSDSELAVDSSSAKAL